MVGGTDYKPTIDEAIPLISDSPEVTPYQLIILFTETINKMPVDFGQSINTDLLGRYQPMVRSYTCGQLYNYLSRTDIWAHPTFTKAVLDEFVIRKDIENYSPRGAE